MVLGVLGYVIWISTGLRENVHSVQIGVVKVAKAMVVVNIIYNA